MSLFALHSSGKFESGVPGRGAAVNTAALSRTARTNEVTVIGDAVEQQYIHNFMRNSYLGRMQRGAECVSKLTKIVAGGTILYGFNRRVSDGEVMGQCARCRILGGVNASQESAVRLRPRWDMQMTRSKALFGLLVVAVAGGAAASGKFGTEELANWFPPVKWLTGDKAVAQSPQGRPGPRAVAVEVGKAVKKK